MDHGSIPCGGTKISRQHKAEYMPSFTGFPLPASEKVNGPSNFPVYWLLVSTIVNKNNYCTYL